MKNLGNKVVYQIYPKSFYDGNNDGIGDLKGITAKLDYLQYLGIDYLWSTPFFVSPQKDNGYDVADYYNIDASFGTMADLEELIAEANKRGIKLMLDMVFNHTSIEHIWFQKALKGEQKYKDYYYFKKAENQQIPTNWESKFGGESWKYVPEFDEYYLCLFDKTQADLNWENPEVRAELIKILEFWLDKGIGGFRFDVINLIDKQEFTNDYEGIGKRFYTDGTRVKDYLKQLNKEVFAGKDIITVGEMSATTIANCIEYTNPQHHELDMAFNFHHLKVDYLNKDKWTSMPFNFSELKQIFDNWQVGMQEGSGWNALFWNCHDQPRSISRFGNDTIYHQEAGKMLATVIHMQQGTPYIYQGEEIGMTNAYFTTVDQYRDVESINAYAILQKKGFSQAEIIQIIQEKSRDNARTPMHWSADDFAGFSKKEPWIQVTDNYSTINVQQNMENPHSLLQYYRKLIQLRKTYKIIQQGIYQPLLPEHNSVYAYTRSYQDEHLIVINNFYEQETHITLPSIDGYELLLSNYSNHDLTTELNLRPYESLVLYRK